MTDMNYNYCSVQFGVPQARLDMAIKENFTVEVIFEQSLGSGIILTVSCPCNMV